MSLLPEAALTRIRALVVDTMGDECRRLQRTDAGSDRHGRPAYSYEPVGDVLVCGIRAKTSTDESGAIIADYTIRLPYGTELEAVDRLRLIGRHGQAFAAPIDGDIVGAVEQGLTAVTVRLKVVEYDN